MNILIDTSIFLWLINFEPKIGRESLTQLSSYKNDVYLSYFSLFEIKIKTAKGKLNFDETVIDDLPVMNITLLKPDINSLTHYKIFNPDNKDPFDNMLLASAQSHNLSFFTADKKILNSDIPEIHIIDATR